MSKKKDREVIFNKFGGRCAYCGRELPGKWHVDELEPCRRKYRQEKGHWVRISDKVKLSIKELNALNLSEEEMAGKYKWIDSRMVFDGYTHPERLNINNQMPSCPSCNINKHSLSLEGFRHMITHFMKHLNEHSTQYIIAKRYGLIKETNIPVVFYFETLELPGG